MATLATRGPPRPERLRLPARWPLLRQINASFATDWDRLQASGFLAELVRRERLIPFEIASLDLAADLSMAHAVIAPEEIEFVSYPYEWTFGELRDAALLTIDLEIAARAAGFTLKDASAYNIQFLNGRPILIDTLSFETAPPGLSVAGVPPVLPAVPGSLGVDGLSRRAVRPLAP